ncbi:hypothetical protein GCM10011608_12930 [Micromonospora sonchi]|uniref:Uncharacterized protein n=1 Tax=Micromonospora sonchi TaxID=1763543 RepID=A0A917TNW2_9ACTN|nr:hypothetical protein GCM10011608_12930 [Micromonospora sonchi]
MARHAKNPMHLGLLRKLCPLKRLRASPLDRLGPATIYPERAGVYRAIGAAQAAYLPERPLLTRAGDYRAGCWS